MNGLPSAKNTSLHVLTDAVAYFQRIESMIAIIIFATLCLAYANGANDNFKGRNSGRKRYNGLQTCIGVGDHHDTHGVIDGGCPGGNATKELFWQRTCQF